MLRKEVFKELPPLVEYILKLLGKSLVEVLWKLNDGGESLLVVLFLLGLAGFNFLVDLCVIHIDGYKKAK
ncbi:hypothetical protein ACK8HY_05910 [Sphingobacterium sp. NGMCC 1.201703]|uniref:hypothetical protein n=1 Tax=Sphingobacterium sp. NGMCC 1.201703 TaxID=3388657 RepID=UPI0039FD2F9B